MQVDHQEIDEAFCYLGLSDHTKLGVSPEGKVELLSCSFWYASWSLPWLLWPLLTRRMDCRARSLPSVGRRWFLQSRLVRLCLKRWDTESQLLGEKCFQICLWAAFASWTGGFLYILSYTSSRFVSYGLVCKYKQNDNCFIWLSPLRSQWLVFSHVVSESLSS